MPLPLNLLFSLYARFGIKVGIACVLAYTFSYWIGSPYPVWGVISTIIAMQINVAESVNAGVMRLTGTAIGAAIGVALLLLIPESPLSMGSSVFVITLLCAFLTRYDARFNAISVAAVVVLLSGALYAKSGHQEAITFGLMRVAEISIGVGCAFLVSVVLWPVRLVDTLRTDLSLQFLECAHLLDALLSAFLARQQQLPYSLITHVEEKVWENHERLSKARKHESLLYHYEHAGMEIQITALTRTTESLRTMIETLNDYDEEGRDILMGAELRALGDAIMSTLRHMGGETFTHPAPDLVRSLTGGVAQAEKRLGELRSAGETRTYDLHKILQFFTFYQAMRVLAESLLIALDRIQNLQNKKKKAT